MNVYITFDVEVWCGGWRDMDQRFQSKFERYVYGRSKHGDYALPQNFEILNRYGLKGVFFVEPLFAARFGRQYLEIIVKLIRAAGHEVQLHLHPEWVNEISPPIIPGGAVKRQHLCYYTLEEQTALVAMGKEMLEFAGSGPVTAFRAGSFASDRNTYRALERNAIYMDSSLNRCYALSGADMREDFELLQPSFVDKVASYPVAQIKDAFGVDRPAQLTACSFGELRGALLDAYHAGVQDFVIVSHCFEMLQSGCSEPDWVVVRRFNRLCEFLAVNSDKFHVRGFETPPYFSPSSECAWQSKASLLATSVRYFEQAYRNVFYR